MGALDLVVVLGGDEGFDLGVGGGRVSWHWVVSWEGVGAESLAVEYVSA